ncbi:VCBS repeat-containing protein [Phormidium tenue FACHB-886]|nr:VCBS repeat-containing protein [Phormidium tenue FACHB-886]
MAHSASTRASRASSGFFNSSFQLDRALRLSIGEATGAGAIADFNNDNNLDLVFTLSNATLSDNVIVRLGNGKGSFGTAQTTAANGNSPIALATGDFNNDGNQDIATANINSNTVSVLLGTGTGTFRTAETFRVGNQPNSIITADLNRDGRLDIVTANANSQAGSLSVLLGTGNGGFQVNTISDRSPRAEPFAVATGDFDKDGRLDLATVEAERGTLTLLFGDGRGDFGDAKTFNLGNIQPVALAVGDFDTDGELDIALTNLVNSTQNVGVLFGDGDGGFERSTFITTNLRGNAIAAQDLDGDGNLDIVTSSRDAGQVAVVRGDGKGSFRRSVSVAVGRLPNSLAIGDLNRDDKPDLVTAHLGETDAAIVLNRSAFVLFREPSDGNSGIVDASKETKVSITADLAKQTLIVNRSSSLRYRLVNYREVSGTQMRDTLTGSGETDTLTGNNGADTLTGGGGNDKLSGGEGSDRLSGSTGNDDLNGGRGNDMLTGDQGSDRFLFSTGAAFRQSDGSDRITDFKRGEDKIVLARKTFSALGRRGSFLTVADRAEAQTSRALITYVRSSGQLFYNANSAAAGFGNGGEFATIAQSNSPNGALGSSDFSVSLS